MTPPTNENGQIVICDGHQELRDIVIELRADVRNSTRNMKDFMTRIEACVQMQGAAIQKIEIERMKPADIVDIKTRLDDVESVQDTQKGIERTAKELSAKTAGTISTTIALIGLGITIVVTFFMGGNH